MHTPSPPSLTTLTQFISNLPLIDVHEHHLPELFLDPNVGLLDLFQQSYAGWTQQRPYSLESETREADPMLEKRPPPTWKDLAPFLEQSGSSSFVRNLLRGLEALYGSSFFPLTEKNWTQLDVEIRKRRQASDWPREIMAKTRSEWIITDPYTNPLLDPVPTLGPNYRSVARINCLALAWHPENPDHNGNTAALLAKRLGRNLSTFDDFLDFQKHLVTTLGQRNQVALKNALAYDRHLNFDPPDPARARAAWGKKNPRPEDRKAFGDFVVDHLCALAAEHDVPFQMHLGTALIRGSHPLHAAGLIERHPRTRFLLMHLAYPWSSDLLAMGFVYRNIWLDLTWSFLLSPTHFKRALHEAIEVLPDESRLMLGGDNWHAEESFATLELFRRLLAEVLSEKVDSGYFEMPDAQRLAKKILSENARTFFKFQ